MELLEQELEIKQARIIAYKSLAYRYGIAMVVLVLNNFLTPYLLYFTLLGPAIALGAGGNGLYTLIMLANELSAYVVPILVLSAVFSRERRDFIPDRTYAPAPGEPLLLFLAGIAAGSAGSILTDLINSVIDAIFKTGEIEDAFGDMVPDDPYQFFVFLFCICVVAPICEEYLFRDILLKPLRCFNDTAAAVFTGIVFGLYHGNFDQFAYAALLGIFYSIIAVRCNSIRPTILLHAANNLLVCLSSYLSRAFGSDLARSVAQVFSTLLTLLLPAGVIAFIFALSRRCFRLHSHDRFITGRESARLLAFSPAVVIGFAVMAADFFI